MENKRSRMILLASAAGPSTYRRRVANVVTTTAMTTPNTHMHVAMWHVACGMCAGKCRKEFNVFLMNPWCRKNGKLRKEIDRCSRSHSILFFLRFFPSHAKAIAKNRMSEMLAAGGSVDAAANRTTFHPKPNWSPFQPGNSRFYTENCYSSELDPLTQPCPLHRIAHGTISKRYDGICVKHDTVPITKMNTKLTRAKRC